MIVNKIVSLYIKNANFILTLSFFNKLNSAHSKFYELRVFCRIIFNAIGKIYPIYLTLYKYHRCFCVKTLFRLTAFHCSQINLRTDGTID